MVNFQPGKTVTTFTDKQGREIVICYPQWEDLEKITKFINEISQEQTFIRYAGEVITLEEESAWLKDVLEKSEAGEYVLLLAFHNDQLVGNVSIQRDHSSARRSLHVGIFGIALRQEFRGAGIGFGLAKAAMSEAEQALKGLRLFRLNVYVLNDRGQQLYRKLGFQEVGRLPEYVLHKGEYIDEIVMVKQVDLNN